MGKKFEFAQSGIGSRAYWLSKIRDGANTTNLLKSATKRQWYDAKAALDRLLAEKLVESVSVTAFPKYELTEWGKQEAARFDEWRKSGGQDIQHPDAKALRQKMDEKPTTIAAAGKVPVAGPGDRPLFNIPESEPAPRIKTRLINKPDPDDPRGVLLVRKEVVMDAVDEPELFIPKAVSYEEPRAAEEPRAPVSFAPPAADDTETVDKAVDTGDNHKPDTSEPAGHKYMDAYHALLHERFGAQISFKEVLERMAA